jgi:hypothetical protein
MIGPAALVCPIEDGRGGGDLVNSVHHWSAGVAVQTALLVGFFDMTNPGDADSSAVGTIFSLARFRG